MLLHRVTPTPSPIFAIDDRRLSRKGQANRTISRASCCDLLSQRRCQIGGSQPSRPPPRPAGGQCRCDRPVICCGGRVDPAGRHCLEQAVDGGGQLGESKAAMRQVGHAGRRWLLRKPARRTAGSCGGADASPSRSPSRMVRAGWTCGTLGAGCRTLRRSAPSGGGGRSPSGCRRPDGSDIGRRPKRGRPVGDDLWWVRPVVSPCRCGPITGSANGLSSMISSQGKMRRSVLG